MRATTEKLDERDRLLGNIRLKEQKRRYGGRPNDFAILGQDKTNSVVGHGTDNVASSSSMLGELPFQRKPRTMFPHDVCNAVFSLTMTVTHVSFRRILLMGKKASRVIR